MIKTIATLFIAAAAMAVMTGCSVVEKADPAAFNGQKVTTAGTPVCHISACTTGLYFLWFPLITGSDTNPGFPTLLKDTVNPNCLSEMITSRSNEAGGKQVVDLVTRSSSSGFLFSIRTAHASGTAVK